MAGARRKSFSNPDETRTPDKTVLELVDLGSVKAARLTVQPPALIDRRHDQR